MAEAGRALFFERAGKGDQVGAGLAVGRDAREGIDHAVLADGHGVDVERALAVGVEDGAVVGVSAGLEVVGDEVQVFEPFGFAHRGFGLAGEALAVNVDGSAGEVMDGLAVGAEGKGQVAIAELVEHAAALGGFGGDALHDFEARHAGVEPEQVSRVAVDAIDEVVLLPPEGLAPVVAHVPGVGGVIAAEVILDHGFPLHRAHGVTRGVVAEDGALRGGEVGGTVPRVHNDGAADGAVGRAGAVFPLGAHFAEALLVAGGQVIAVEDAAGPGQGKETAPAGVHVHGEHALALRADAVVLELAGLQVVGEQVAARVGFIARRGDAHGFLAVHVAVHPDVGGEIELMILLDEVDVALALGNGLAALFAAGFRHVAHFLDLLGPGIEAEHPGALVNILRAQDVVDLPVAAGAHRVVAVVPQGKVGVIDPGDDFPAFVGLAVRDDEARGGVLRGADENAGAEQRGGEREQSVGGEDSVHRFCG